MLELVAINSTPPPHRSGLSPGQRQQFALGMMPAGGRGKGDGACCQAEPPLECSLRDPGPRIIMDHPFIFSLSVFALKGF